jgi:hypothetical protein
MAEYTKKEFSSPVWNAFYVCFSFILKLACFKLKTEEKQDVNLLLGNSLDQKTLEEFFYDAHLSNHRSVVQPPFYFLYFFNLTFPHPHTLGISYFTLFIFSLFFTHRFNR